MIAVVLLLGVVAAVLVARSGQDTVRNLAAQGAARLLELDLMQAQRRAISTGDNHYLQFTSSGPTVTGYQLYRRAAGGDVTVDDQRQVAAGVTVAISHSTMEYAFSGAALAAYQIDIDGPAQSWIVSVTPATGHVRLQAAP
jgi:hypothetical protein